MKVICIVQARLGSERLPNKVLLQIPPESGISMLEMVVRKCLLATMVDDVVVVTPDKELVKICKLCHLDYYFVYSWPQRDVLREYYETAAQLNILFEPNNLFVRITADCPLIRPEIIDAVVREFLSCRPDFDIAYNTDESTGQLKGEGSDVEVFSFEALEQAYKRAKDEEREHPTLWMRRNLRCRFVPCLDLGIRSVNTMDDYRFVCDYIRK